MCLLFLLGTRFRPLSLQVPKPLFPLAGSPMIEHHIESCKKVSSINEVLLIGNYQYETSLKDFVYDMQRDHKIQVRYLQEYTPLGTAGGLYHFRDQIARTVGSELSNFFVLNSDVCCDFPLSEMIDLQKHTTNGTGFVIMGTKCSSEGAMKYGCIVTEPNSTKVLHYVEKPETYVSDTINAGAYLFSSEIFKHMAHVFDEQYKNEIDYSNKDHISLERKVLPALVGTEKLHVYRLNRFWSQVKSGGSAIYANRFYLSLFCQRNQDRLASNSDGHATILGDVRIHPTAKVDRTATLGPNVYISAGVRIAAGARVRESIILDRAELKEHCCVLYTIVGWDSVVGEWSRVEGHSSDPNPNDPYAHVQSDSLFNTDGRLNPSITILGQGVSVAKEVMVLNSIVLPHKSLIHSKKNQIIL